MERYAIIIRPNEETVLLHCYPGDSLDLKTLQEIVEGNIETVPTALAGEWSHERGVGLTLIINEEGKLLGLPVNQLATDMAYIFNDVIVGNAILIWQLFTGSKSATGNPYSKSVARKVLEAKEAAKNGTEDAVDDSTLPPWMQ